MIFRGSFRTVPVVKLCTPYLELSELKWRGFAALLRRCVMAMGRHNRPSASLFLTLQLCLETIDRVARVDFDLDFKMIKT